MNPDTLYTEWLHRGGDRVTWGSRSAFNDSVTIARQILPDRQAFGFAALRYRDATGNWPDVHSGQRYDVAPIGLKPNWITKVGGLPLFARAVAHALIRGGHTESDAIQIAIGVIQDWAHGGGNVTAKTRAKAAATVAEWTAKKAAADATRDGFVTEGGTSGAGLLLPKVGAPMTTPHLPTAGGTRGRCKKCGENVTAKVHTDALGQSRRLSGARQDRKSVV